MDGYTKHVELAMRIMQIAPLDDEVLTHGYQRFSLKLRDQRVE